MWQRQTEQGWTGYHVPGLGDSQNRAPVLREWAKPRQGSWRACEGQLRDCAHIQVQRRAGCTCRRNQRAAGITKDEWSLGTTGAGVQDGAGEDVEGTGRLSGAGGSPKQGLCGQHPEKPHSARAQGGVTHSYRAPANHLRANMGQEHYRT